MEKRLIAILLCLLCLAAQSGLNAQPVPSRIPHIEATRVIAVGDIHGAYQALTELLQTAGLINRQLQWQGNDSHLVILGDMVDRGSESRQVLDLLMRLETEAGDAGGAVDIILGDHEVMVLVGDLRYVSQEDFANYIDLEDSGQRQQAWMRFLVEQDDAQQNSEELLKEFERRYPPGFFGHREAFSLSGDYGEWLRHKPVLIRVNDSGFVHGGILFENPDMDIGSINPHAEELLQGYLSNVEKLIDGNVLFPESGFNNHPAIIQAWLAGLDEAGKDSELAAIARETEQLWLDELFGSNSPFWYRGMASCSPWLEYDRSHSLLDTLSVSRLVVGHTPTSDRQVQSRFNGSLLFADTGMLKSVYAGQASALLIEAGQVQVLYPEKPDLNVPTPQPRMVGPRPIAIDDDQLEQLLNSASIVGNTAREDGNTELELADGERRVTALFIPAVESRRRRTFIPEVAAYRLDRLLALDMVPVAVKREFNGRPGAVLLQTNESWMNEARRSQSQDEMAWCALADQLKLMYVFDNLIHNQGRTMTEILYRPGSLQLTLIGNRRILARDNKLPAYLANAPLLFSPYQLSRLASLNSALLEDQLGDVLDRGRRRALLRRRDLLLKMAQAENKSEQ